MGSQPLTGATGIRIRDATEADLPAIVEIHNAAIASRISTAQLEAVTVEAGANGFVRIHRHNIQFGSRNWRARLPAGLASGNFSRAARIAVR
jgi:L-amino acid N-acyltransferase YncA